MKSSSRSLSRPTFAASLAVAAGLVAAAALAQGGGLGGAADTALAQARPGMAATAEETQAFALADAGRHIKAREIAEQIVARDPHSFAGHFVLAYVYHYGEANFPRALFHLDIAYAEYVHRYGQEPQDQETWRWFASILRELVATHADLEHYEEQLAWMARYNEQYRPEMIAETAWPLMKLRRFDDAREAARLGEASGDGRQYEIALNARCAVEFEAGDEEASYAACRAAMELHGGDPATQSAVDFTNFAEAARSVFRFDEAERVGLLATEAQLSWYGNPHLELGELYTREGRFVEALAQLRQVHPYRLRRPPHVQDADRNEARRALAEFFLVIGRSEDAMRITSRAVLAPDRRAHNSRDPSQDLAIAALLDRRARLMRAEALMTESLGGPWLERISAFFEASALRVQAWQSGRQAARAAADDTRLVGTFMIGTSRSAVTPPWLTGELVEVLGAGVVAEAVRRARVEDTREGAAGYYDAFEAEAALSRGDSARATELGERALTSLAPAEVLLRARVSAIMAEAARREGRASDALAAYDAAFQRDPGIFVRMDLSVPVRIVARGGAIAQDAASLMAWSGRFDIEDVGLRIDVEADAQRSRTCLVSSAGAVLGCGESERESAETQDEWVARIVREFHRSAFAPRVDLSQADASSLDGANTVGGDALGDLGDL